MAVYFLFQFNAIAHHGSWGQDFGTHLLNIARAYQDPYRFWTTYVENQTNPPLFYLMCAGVYRLTNHSRSVEAISQITVLLNAGAVLLLHRVSLRLIAAPELRVAAFVFLLFVPAGMIHAIVLAADSVATPATVLLMYLLVRLGEAGKGRLREFVGWAAAALVALASAVSIKFTAVALVPAAAAVIVLLWVARQTSFRRAALGLLLVTVAPAALGYTTYRQFKHSPQGSLGVSMALNPFAPETELNVRSLVFFRAADVNLLKAPPFNAPSNEFLYGQRAFDLAIPNRYSYIALLHLGVFTDILNVYQYDPDDSYFGRRSAAAQRRMSLAVKTALPFTATALVAVPWMLLWSSWRVVVRRDRQFLAALTVLIVSFAFFLVIVIFLPFTWALGGGYWLPRLVIPALFGFFLVTFGFLDRTAVGKTRSGRLACLAATIFQALVSLSFLLPWGVNARKPSDLNTLVPSDLAVRAEMNVRFTPQPAGTADPLVTVGRINRAFFVFARHDGRGQVRIMFTQSQWGGEPDVSHPESLPADPSYTYNIKVHSNPGDRYVAVSVDDREVLRITKWIAPAAFRDEIHILTNPIAGGPVAEQFSGVVTSSRYDADGGERWGRRQRRRSHPSG